MPTPIAHSLCGYIIYSSVKIKDDKINWKTLFSFIVLANLADLDYLPGIYINKPNIFHHGLSHSIVAAIIVGLSISVIYKFNSEKKFFKNFILFSSLYLSHVVLDFFTVDTSIPLGEQLFWPFTNEYYISSISLFRDISKGSTTNSFFLSVFEFYNVITGVTECMIFLPFILIIKFIKTKINKKHIYES